MSEKEVYLSNLEWTKTHNNMGGVKGDLIFKDNMSYEEYKKILKETYFILSDKRIQSNWNSLRKCIIGVIEGAREELNTIIHTTDIDTKEGLEYVNQCSREFDVIRKNLEIVLDEMNKLEGNESNGK